jgi:Tol biopolymer transport system component
LSVESNMKQSKRALLWSLALSNPVIFILAFKSFLIGTAVSTLFVITILLSIKHLRRDSFTQVFVLNILTILTLFFSGEVIFRYLYPQYIIPNLYVSHGDYYYNMPELEQKFEDKEYTSYYYTNTQGHRISKTLDPKTEIQACDWLFLGDSYTQGAQVNFEELYTSILHDIFPSKTILNAGISGFDIAEEYNLMATLYNELKPSRVFIQVCNFNDFMNIGTNSYSLLERLSSSSDLVRYAFYDFIYKGPDNLPAGRWAEPFYLSDKDNREFNIFYKGQSEKKKSDIEAFFSYLDKIKIFLMDRNVDLTIIQLPSKEEAYQSYFDEVIEAYTLDTTLIDLNYPNKILKKWADINEVQVVDVKKSINEIPENIYFDFDEHLNVYGHRALAGIIASSLDQERSKNKIRRLSKSSAGDRYPSYINDNTQILYQSIRAGNFEILISDSGLSEENQITHNEVNDFHPVYSSDLRAILYSQGDINYQRTNIIYYDILTGKTLALTPQTSEYGAIPTEMTVAGDYAYAGWEFDSGENKYTRSRIVMANMLSKSKHYISPENHSSWRPSFSSDRSLIAYISDVEGNYDIFLYNRYLNTTTQITKTPYDEWDPSFSKNDSIIVYAANPDDNFDLFMVDLSVQESTRLTETIGNEWDPSFDDQNSRIIFAGDYGLINGIYELSLH